MREHPNRLAWILTGLAFLATIAFMAIAVITGPPIQSAGMEAATDVRRRALIQRKAELQSRIGVCSRAAADPNGTAADACSPDEREMIPQLEEALDDIEVELAGLRAR